MKQAAGAHRQLTVTAPSRIHMGLFDCGNATLRVFGGIGFALDAYPTKVRAVLADDWSVNFASPPATRLKADADRLVGVLRG